MGFALVRIVAYRLQGLSRNKTSEGLQSSRNGMTSYGLTTEMHSFFMNAWPARGVGMLSSYRGFKACDRPPCQYDLRHLPPHPRENY